MAWLRKKIDPQNCSLLELCYLATGSYVAAAKVSAYVVAWATVRRSLGRDPSVEEYAEYWRMSRRQGFYEQARFRSAFPGLDDPGRLVDELERQLHGPADRADFGDLLPA